jgi:hypothetical protein
MARCTTIKDYRTILRIIDRTFTRHERRLVELRKETVAYIREQLTEAHIATHLTPLPAPEESSERPLPSPR